jgi:hypothetical protein
MCTSERRDDGLKFAFLHDREDFYVPRHTKLFVIMKTQSRGPAVSPD